MQSPTRMVRSKQTFRQHRDKHANNLDEKKADQKIEQILTRKIKKIKNKSSTYLLALIRSQSQS